MTSRISTQSMTSSMGAQLLSAEAKYNDLSNKVLTQREISKASDSPATASKIMITQKQLNEYSMFTKSISSANTQINGLESTLQQTTTSMERVIELVTSASNETNDESSMQAIKDELEEIQKTLVTLANTQIDGQYIFSGSNVETPAYTIDDKGNIAYQGSSKSDSGSVRQLEISDGVYVSLNTTGDNIFGEFKVDDDGTVTSAYGLFGTIGMAMKAMDGVTTTNPDGTTTTEIDFDTIREQIDVIQDEVTNLTTVRSQFGSYAQRLESTQNAIDENEITTESRRSELQDIDVVETLTELANQEYALQASMQITSNMLTNTLLNYI